MNGTRVYLALGSNLGDRLAALQTAIDRLAPAVTVDAQSGIYETAPMYVAEQPAFLNMVVGGRTDMGALDLLDFLKSLERDIGRVPSVVNGPRAIDLDILYFADVVLETDRLTLPHPRIAERAFVLVPLADIAAGLMDPSVKRTVVDMLDAVSGREEVVPFVNR
ncbi:MAG: 2-amino-4-hydroxy-6-hydroxymethyldihydropteridine diphosphokinase [Alphaproteobacteria bacterium]